MDGNKPSALKVRQGLQEFMTQSREMSFGTEFSKEFFDVGKTTFDYPRANGSLLPEYQQDFERIGTHRSQYSEGKCLSYKHEIFRGDERCVSD